MKNQLHYEKLVSFQNLEDWYPQIGPLKESAEISNWKINMFTLFWQNYTPKGPFDGNNKTYILFFENVWKKRNQEWQYLCNFVKISKWYIFVECNK